MLFDLLIVLMADVVENMFIEKDLETRNLQQRLRDAESTLAILTRDTNTNLNNLKVHLNEKYKTTQEIEQQMANFQKEWLEKQDALTVEVIERNKIIMSLQKQMTVLQEQYRFANIQIQFKDDIIKEMQKELKLAMTKV
ncbi:uncharacterized protein LOC143143583 [Ptiloglossa arizonensis]|uniref:uncharacterized protein LOC143143583 n=1 Tax=Ptiloglossa arizonensis TaxID=3350558 RepID=UPI003FA0F21C